MPFTFRTGLSFSAAGVLYLSSLQVADFDGDGKLDLAVASLCIDTCSGNGSAGVSVLLGNGDATFQPPQHYSFFGFFTAGLAVADFNRDGRPDLVAAVTNDCRGLQQCQGNVVNILLGNGDGTFSVGLSYPSGGRLLSNYLGVSPVSLLTVADFNGDGKDDLAIVNPCVSKQTCSNGVLRVLLGKGDGTFRVSERHLALGLFAAAGAAGDFNGDGRADLAVSDKWKPESTFEQWERDFPGCAELSDRWIRTLDSCR